MIEYKGYIGAVDFDPEIDLFHGTVINTNDVITFYGASVSELREEMEKSVEGYLEFCRELGITPEKPFSGEFTIQMSPERHCKLALRNTINYILEYKRYLAGANEATTKQYVILPILRALGWNDANLASMEFLPECRTADGGEVDYALKVGRNPDLFVECKRWNEPLDRHENQIVNYASNSNVPVAVLTNGKIWRFYLSKKEEMPVSERNFCDIDNENIDAAVVNLEKYLLKYNVLSGYAVGEAEKTWENKEKIVNSVPQDKKDYYRETYPLEKMREFYRCIALTQDLVRKKDWELEQKFTRRYCGFWLRGRTGQRKRLVYGIHLDYTPLRFFVKVTEEDAEELRLRYRCEVVYYHPHAGQAHYTVREDVKQLLGVLEFAYNKHYGK